MTGQRQRQGTRCDAVTGINPPAKAGAEANAATLHLPSTPGCRGCSRRMQQTACLRVCAQFPCMRHSIGKGRDACLSQWPLHPHDGCLDSLKNKPTTKIHTSTYTRSLSDIQMKGMTGPVICAERQNTTTEDSLLFSYTGYHTHGYKIYIFIFKKKLSTRAEKSKLALLDLAFIWKKKHTG